MVRRYSHTNYTLRLHEELLDFAAFISPTATEEKRRTSLLTRLSDLTASLFPASSLRPFGSYATKLYLPMGDLDCCLFDAPFTALHQLHRALEREGWASYLEHITSARIPIVKFMDRSSGLRVDVCMDQRVGLEAAQYIIGMSVKFPAFRPLLLFLKYYLHVRRLNDTYSGGVGSYLLQLMLLSHLHFHPAQTFDVNLGLLLLSFFDTYGNQLNYQTVGLSLSPPAFYNKHDRQRFNPQRPLLLSAENPLDSTHDVGVNSFGVMRVRRAMQYGYGRLTERSVMEGKWDGSLLALVLGVVDDDELRERGDKKDREREKRQKKERKEIKKQKKARREREEQEEKVEEEEQEEGEITVVDDSDEEKAPRDEYPMSGRLDSEEEEEEGAYHEHRHHSDEEKMETGIEPHANSKRNKQREEHVEHAAEEKEEKHDTTSVSSSAKQSASVSSTVASSSSVPSSSSSPSLSTSTSSSTSKKWRPGQPFPDKWLKLFSRHEVSAVLEQMELDETAQAEALEQFKLEKKAYQLAREQSKIEKKKQAKVANGKGAADHEPTEKERQDAEQRYFLSWQPHRPIPAEWVRVFTPSEFSDIIDKRSDLDDRTRRRLMMDFKRDKDELQSRVEKGESIVPVDEAPRSLATWKKGDPIPAEWLATYSEHTVKEALYKRSDLGKKARKRMVQQFKDDQQFYKKQEKDERAKRVSEEMKAQPGLYDVEEEWLTMSRSQVDRLLQERGMERELRIAVLRQWLHKLMRKTDPGERQKKTEAGTWTEQDEHEWMKWKGIQKIVMVELPRQEGVEEFSIPVEWLEWDKQKMKLRLQDWHITGALKVNVMRQWRERTARKDAGKKDNKHEKGSEQIPLAERENQLKDDLKKLEIFKKHEKAIRREEEETEGNVDKSNTAAPADTNETAEGRESGKKRRRKDKRREEESITDDESDDPDDEWQPDQHDSAAKRQRVEEEDDEEQEEEEEDNDDDDENGEQNEAQSATSHREPRQAALKAQQLIAVHAAMEAPRDRASQSSRPSTRSTVETREQVRARVINDVKRIVLQRLVKQAKAAGRKRKERFPKSAADNELYKAEWTKELEKRVEAELNGGGQEVNYAVDPNATPPLIEPSPLSKPEKNKVRSQVRSAVLKRLQLEKKAGSGSSGKKETHSFPNTKADHELLTSEIEKELSSKTAAEWRQQLQQNGGASELEEHKRLQAEQLSGVPAATVKRVRREVLDRFREQRRNEYKARKQTPPQQLAKLFPLDGNDQKMLEKALEEELEKIRKKPACEQLSTPGGSNSNQNGHASSVQKKHTTASVAAGSAAEPVVIDLIDDDEDSVASAPATSERSAGEEATWAEKAGARPKRRVEEDDRESFEDEMTGAEEKDSTRSSKRARVDDE